MANLTESRAIELLCANFPIRANKLLAIMVSDFACDDASMKRAYDHLVSIANNLGACVIRSNDDEEHPFGWSGDYIRVDSQTQTRATYDLAHEIGHLMAASPSRRNLPEFGLGAGFSTVGDAKQVLKDEVCDREEDYACMLAALLLNWVGLPNKSESELVQFLDFHGQWNNQFGVDKRVPELIEELIGYGLIDEHLMLTFKLRSQEDTWKNCSMRIASFDAE